MPTAHYNITNNYVMKLVNENNLEKLDEYLKDNFNATKLKPKSTTYCHISPDIGSSKDFEDKIYDILSYAVDAGNLIVLQHYNKYINNDQYDGNTYTLLHLAIDKYNFYYTDEKKELYLDILKCVVDAYVKNCIYVDHIDFYIKQLENNTELLHNLEMYQKQLESNCSDDSEKMEHQM